MSDNYDKVINANVFITKSLPAIEQMHFGDNRLQTFQQGLSRLTDEELRQSFIASPLKNDGLLRFEFSFESNKSKGGKRVTIKLLETSKLLEIFLLENDPLARIINSKLKQQVPFKGSGDAYDLMGIANEELSFEDSLKLSNQYYVSFGTSDNVDEWSGPFSMNLVQAKLSNDKFNNRVIEVSFVPNESSLKSWSKNFEKQLGYKGDLSNMSQFMTSETYQSCLGKRHLDLGADGPKHVYDFDFIVRDVVRNYIDAMTSLPGQSVVVLPQKFGAGTIAPGKDKQEGTFFGPITIPGESILKEKIFLQKSFLTGGAPVPMGFGNVDRNLKKLGLNNEYTNILQYSKTSKGLNDYLEENGFNSVPENANDATFNVDVSKRIAEEEEARWEKENSRILEDNLATLTQARDAEVQDAESKREIALAAAAIAPIAQLRVQYLIPFPDIPDTEVRQVATENINAIADRKINYADATFEAGSTEARSNYDNSQKPGTAAYREVENRINAKVGNERLSNINRGLAAFGVTPPPASNLLGPGLGASGSRTGTSVKTVTTKNPSLLGFTGAMDDVKNQAVNTDMFRKYELITDAGNIDANFDLVVEAANTLAGIPHATYSIFMEQRNEPPQQTFDGFHPLVSPLIKFSSALKTLDQAADRSSQFDFYEESDMRILKLWKEAGIIQDSSKPAYVFGDMNQIKSLFYFEEGEELLDDHAIATTFNLGSFDDRSPSYNHHEANSLALETMAKFSLVNISKDSLSTRNSVGKQMRQAYKEKFFEVFPDDNAIIKFTHNKPRSNVISLDYNIDGYYAALLNMPVRPLLDKSTIGSTRAQVFKKEATKVLGKGVMETLSNYKSFKTFDSFYTNIQKGGKTTVDLALAVTDSEALTKGIKYDVDLFLLMFLCLNADEVSADLEDTSENRLDVNANQIAKYYKKVMDESSRLLVRNTVKTLPMFNIKSYLGRKCVLDGTTGGIVGGSEELRRPAPYNGDYQIVGYKHVISPNSIFSEFDIVRGLANTDIPAGATVKKFICKAFSPLLKELDEAQEKADEFAGYFEDASMAEIVAGRPRADFEIKYGKGSVDKMRKALEDLGCGEEE